MGAPKRMTRQQYQTLKIQDFDRLEARIMYLERLLDRAYPLLHNPYTQQTDPLAATTYDTIIREVEIVIQHLKEEDDPERANLPCASCDGKGCPNCQPPSYRCGKCGAALDLDGTCPVAWEEAQ